MQQYMRKFLDTPRRVPPTRAKRIVVLALIMFGFAAAAFFSYTGLSRGMHVAAFSLIGLSDLTLAIGSLLPEDGGGRAARDAMRPLVIVMLIVLLATVALDVTGSV